MRQWMVNPKIMCRRHLLGEHLEAHMFLGSILKGKKIQGYLNNNLLEPMSLFARHAHLVMEMEKRGYCHNSPMKSSEFFQAISLIPSELIMTFIDSHKSLEDLLSRCPEYRKRYEES